MNFIKRLRQRSATRKILKRKELFRRGFDYAAGALLREEKTPFQLEAEQDGDHYDPFDRGMTEAIHQLVSMGIASDNRI